MVCGQVFILCGVWTGFHLTMVCGQVVTLRWRLHRFASDDGVSTYFILRRRLDRFSSYDGVWTGFHLTMVFGQVFVHLTMAFGQVFILRWCLDRVFLSYDGVWTGCHLTMAFGHGFCVLVC